MVDALVDRTDEGRDGLRYASGSCRVGFDPRISEWGDPATVMSGHHSFCGGYAGKGNISVPAEKDIP